MENAVEALKMAFAVMAFMLALSVSIISFNKVKEVSDIVLYAKDETNYYEYYQDYDGEKGKAAENRIVGLETIIPTLYKYYKENYTVIFREASYDEGVFSNVKPLSVYETKSNDKTSNGTRLWGSNKKDDKGNTYNTYEKLMNDKYSINIEGYKYSALTNKDIFSFDLEEETLRHEPWTGSFEKARENLNCFLSGGIYKNPNNNTDYIEYDGFINKYKNAKFIETIGEYEYSSNQENNSDTEDGSTINSLVKKKKKRVIIFTLIKN